MSSKLHRFVRPVVIFAAVLVGLRTCMMLLYFLGDNFYAGVGDVGAYELAQYGEVVQSADRTPQWSLDGETIAVNIGDYIYTVSIDGEDLRRIPEKISAESKYGVYSPSLSPDGRVAYRIYLEEDVGFFELITDPDGNYIESANLDGSDVKRVAYTGNLISNPVFSPDGSRIAFSTSEHGLTTAKSDGSDVRRLDSSVRGLAGRWSNDGQQIAIVTARDENRRAHMLVNMRWDATDPIIITEGLGDEPVISLPDWSPSDDRLYFAKKDQATPPGRQSCTLSTATAPIGG